MNLSLGVCVWFLAELALSTHHFVRLLNQLSGLLLQFICCYVLVLDQRLISLFLDLCFNELLSLIKQASFLLRLNFDCRLLLNLNLFVFFVAFIEFIRTYLHFCHFFGSNLLLLSSKQGVYCCLNLRVLGLCEHCGLAFSLGFGDFCLLHQCLSLWLLS